MYSNEIVIRDRSTKRTYIVESETDLYRVAIDLSLYHRGAICFTEDAKTRELLDDIRGLGCCTIYADEIDE